MMRVLGVERRRLPSAIEHIEGMVADMWVRVQVGAVHRDRLSGRMFLQTLLTSCRSLESIRTYLTSTSTAEVDSILVITEPDDPVSFILGQTAPHDILVVAYPGTTHTVGSFVVYGPRAFGAQDVPDILDENEFRDMPIASIGSTHHDTEILALRLHDDYLDKAS